MSDRMRWHADAPATGPSPGHRSLWRCDKCLRFSGIYEGRKHVRKVQWWCAGCVAAKGAKR